MNKTTNKAKLSQADALGIISSGKSLAEHRGLDSNALTVVFGVVTDLIKAGDYRHALAGCRFLCVHDDDNPGWWMLHGQVARNAGEYEVAVNAYLTAFAIAPLPRFCAELAKTYLAAGEPRLAAEALDAGEQIIAHDGDLDKSAKLLAELADELRDRNSKKAEPEPLKS